jgi:hypothetical protein
MKHLIEMRQEVLRELEHLQLQKDYSKRIKKQLEKKLILIRKGIAYYENGGTHEKARKQLDQALLHYDIEQEIYQHWFETEGYELKKRTEHDRECREIKQQINFINEYLIPKNETTI